MFVLVPLPIWKQRPEVQGDMVQEAGKHERLSLMAADDVLHVNSCLVLTDYTIKINFLTDTGEDLCCYSRKLFRERRRLNSL